MASYGNLRQVILKFPILILLRIIWEVRGSNFKFPIYVITQHMARYG